MISSDYVPINKKKYVSRMVELEAENKALQKKIKAYEDILKSKLNEKTTPEIVEINDYPDEVRHDAETLFFKKNAYIYIRNPQKNETMIPNLVKHIMNPKKVKQLNKNEVELFLKFF